MELGIGIGWRPEIADAVERLPGLDWVEVVAENVCAGHLPASLTRLRSRGTRIVPHGVSLGLGGADRPSEQRLAELAGRAEALDAPLVTEHIAFVRAGGALTASPVLEAGHLLPVPRTWDALKVLCENVRIAQDSLPVPLALENIAALICWPDEQLTEGQFLAELVERTGVRLLIDVANLHTNHVNRGEDPSRALDELPVEAIAYVHVAGGIEREGVWHDTHAHPVTKPVLDILAELRSRVAPPGVLLERDDDFPSEAELEAELTTIRTVVSSVTAAPPAGAHRSRDLVHASHGPLTTVRHAAAPSARAAGDAAATAAPEAVTASAAAVAHMATERDDAVATRPAGAEDSTGIPAGRATTAAPATGETRTSATREASSARRAARRPAGAEIPAAAMVSAGQPEAAFRAVAEPDTAQHPFVAGAEAADAAATPAVPVAAPQASAPAAPTRPDEVPARADAPRQRVALAQAALLSALVAGTPAPEGFDLRRLRVQSRALAAKRADVVAKVAPELPEILGTGYRPAFLAYAKARPMQAGYRRDALDFAEHLLVSGHPEDAEARRSLTHWWRERATVRPPRRATRLVRAARAALVRR
ncbi:DUF692 domain-containing protein [Streptomyces sp. NPDC058572]|uniref:DUF692 domain-containing protein n=1 Tax=Streptomyces sp. NPDC058572 TaxID=3346546 RepID=UPI0036569F31